MNHLIKAACIPAFALLAACGATDSEPDASYDAEPMEEAIVDDGGETAEPSPVETGPASVKINVGRGTLVSPSDFQVAVLFYNVIGLEPPFRNWASSDNRVRRANEFDRPDALARAQEELLLASQAVGDIGFIQINTDSNFGEYDMTSQGFRLQEIDGDRFWRWNYEGNTYTLTMENGNEASLWKIPPDQARNIVETLRRRNVDLQIRFQIVGAVPQPSGGGKLLGKIVSYEVLGKESTKLGSMEF